MSPAAASAAVSAPRHAARASGWPAQIWAVLCGTFLVRAAGFSYPFLALHLQTDLHLSPGITGAVLAVFGGGWLVGQLLAGWLADRIGRRSTLVSTMAVAAATLPLLAAAHSLPAVIVTAAVAGACYDAPRPVVSALVVDIIATEAGRATVSGWRHFAVNVGAAVTGCAGGLLADDIGIPALLWINAAACALFAGLALLFLPADSPAVHRPSRPTAKATALGDGRLWLLWIASLSSLTCAVGLFSALPLLMSAQHLSAAAYGGTQAANAVVVIVLSPALTPWLSRRAAGPRPLLGVFAAGSLVVGGGMAAAGFASTTGQFTAAVAVAVPGELVVFVAATDLLNRIAPAHARGLYAGIWGTTLAGAVIVAPLLASCSLTYGGPHLVAATTFSAGVLAAGLCLPLKALMSRPPRHEAPSRPGALAANR